jgi:hypothetical protein
LETVVAANTVDNHHLHNIGWCAITLEICAAAVVGVSANSMKSDDNGDLPYIYIIPGSSTPKVLTTGLLFDNKLDALFLLLRIFSCIVHTDPKTMSE